jgi:hypothetical protein
MEHKQENTSWFAHERLDAYGLSLCAVQFVAARRSKLRGLPGKAGEQLERAVVGAQTAVCSAAAAEGAERRRLFRGALSEASEAGGATDTALAYGAFTRAEYEALRHTLLRLCACLYRLAHR